MKKEQKVKVQFGWMVFANQKFTQVRTQKGGGTRLVEMSLSATYKDILEQAKSSFFPNGMKISYNTNSAVLIYKSEPFFILFGWLDMMNF